MFQNSHPGYFFTKDGTRIFYNTNFPHKNGLNDLPVLVFNYGLICNFAHWREQIPFFENKGFNILLHDYRGHFNSSGQNHIENCTFKNFTNDLHQLLASLGIKKPIMFGHSMGVNITLEYAKLYSDNISSMILISGSVIPPQDVMFDSNIVDLALPYIKIFTEKFPDIFNTIWKNSYLLPPVRKIIHDGGFNTKKVPEEFVELYMKKISQLNSALFFQLFKEMHDHDIINHIKSIKTPALIIGGDKDKVIPNYLQNILKKYLTNSELYIVKDGSHVPQVDFPDFINARIHRFITKNHSS